MKGALPRFLSLSVTLLCAAPLFAHHGTATYDLNKTITLDGKVTAFSWDNPHCLVHLDAKDETGSVRHWTLELASPFTMTRIGWNKNSMKAGDEVLAETHPARNGLPLGISAAAGYILKLSVNGQALPPADSGLLHSHH